MKFPAAILLLMWGTLSVINAGEGDWLSAEEKVVAITLLAEARGEGARGMTAVAEVIRNRAESRGIAPAQVCLQPRQFSCWNASSGKITPRLSALLDLPEAVAAGRLARQLSAGTLATNLTGGAKFYHATTASPSWSRKQQAAAIIGRHTFYAALR